MKFKLTNTAFWIDEDRYKKYQKYGLEFTRTGAEYGEHGAWQQKIETDTEIEISTLDDLMKFIKDVGEIVITKHSGPTIEIYDDYRE